MSKLAHSHKPSMDAIGFKAALEDGNEDMAEDYWWVRHNGIVRVAEWRQEQDYRGKWRWSFFFTNCEEADAKTVEVLERIEGAKRMTEKKPDGGPAFPLQLENRDQFNGSFFGMSLRDRFAIAFVQSGALLDARDLGPVADSNKFAAEAERFSKCVYALADAMLAEKDKT